MIEYHDYLLGSAGNTTMYPKGWLPDGTPARYPMTNGWYYTGGYPYPDTAQSRTDLATHVGDWVKFVGTRNTFGMAINEFGINNPGNEGPYGTDAAACFDNTAQAQVQMWWDYDTQPISANGFSARPGGVWRAAVTNWMAV
jgi:hypothetical protein